MGEERSVYVVLMGKPEGKKPYVRCRHGWADNIKMDLKEIGRGGLYRINLACDRDKWWAFVNTVTVLGVPSNAGNFLTS
jgi:hypothetical protein